MHAPRAQKRRQRKRHKKRKHAGATQQHQQKPEQDGQITQRERMFQAVRSQTESEGQALDPMLRRMLENAYGESLQDVRVHHDEAAQRKNDMLNAVAHTEGNDIFFGADAYQPGTPEGDQLIAHEVAHTVQQESGAPSTTGKSAEQDAERAATRAPFARREGMARPHMHVAPGIQRRTELPKSKISSFAKSVKKTSANKRTFLVRGTIGIRRFLQRFPMVDMYPEKRAATVKRRVSGRQTDFYAIDVWVQSYADKDIKRKFLAKFPAGSETIVAKGDTSDAFIGSLVKAFQKKRPGAFSKLQGHLMMSAPEDTRNKCLGTMNRGVEKLYGTDTVKRSDLSPSYSFASINKLKAMKRATSFTISATYTGSYPIPARSSIVLGKSLAEEIFQKVKKKGDGVYAALLSIANGYHSATVIAYKEGSKIIYAWRDQLRTGGFPTEFMTGAQIDSELQRWMMSNANHELGEAKSRLLRKHARAPLTAAELQRRAEGRALKTFRKNIRKNIVGLLIPKKY